MQRVLALAGGIKSYLASPDCLFSDETRCCPFCDDPHPLRVHGWYERYVILPPTEGTEQIPVRRLLCARVGRTVSLLPDFCLPRRQHGAGVLGLFLHGRVAGLSLLAALCRARGECGPWHSVAQSLERGFLAREDRIRAYLSRLRARLREPGRAGPQRRLCSLVLGLVGEASSVVAAFVHHGRQFHDQFQLGLA
jgi:hypothetical protein